MASSTMGASDPGIGPSSLSVGGLWLIRPARTRSRSARRRPPPARRPGGPCVPAAWSCHPGPPTTIRSPAGRPSRIPGRAVAGTWDQTKTAAGRTVLTAWASARRGTRPPSCRTSTPRPASSACSAYTGSTCCSSSAQARTTGRIVRAGGASVMTANRVVSSEPDSMCSTATSPATAGSRTPSSSSAGTASCCQAVMIPCRAKALPSMEHSSGASSRTAAWISSVGEIIVSAGAWSAGPPAARVASPAAWAGGTPVSTRVRMARSRIRSCEVYRRWPPALRPDGPIP